MKRKISLYIEQRILDIYEAISPGRPGDAMAEAIETAVFVPAWIEAEIKHLETRKELLKQMLPDSPILAEYKFSAKEQEWFEHMYDIAVKNKEPNFPLVHYKGYNVNCKKSLRFYEFKRLYQYWVKKYHPG